MDYEFLFCAYHSKQFIFAPVTLDSMGKKIEPKYTFSLTFSILSILFFFLCNSAFAANKNYWEHKGSELDKQRWKTIEVFRNIKRNTPVQEKEKLVEEYILSDDVALFKYALDLYMRLSVEDDKKIDRLINLLRVEKNQLKMIPLIYYIGTFRKKSEDATDLIGSLYANSFKDRGWNENSIQTEFNLQLRRTYIRITDDTRYYNHKKPSFRKFTRRSKKYALENLIPNLNIDLLASHNKQSLREFEYTLERFREIETSDKEKGFEVLKGLLSKEGIEKYQDTLFESIVRMCTDQTQEFVIEYLLNAENSTNSRLSLLKNSSRCSSSDSNSYLKLRKIWLKLATGSVPSFRKAALYNLETELFSLEELDDLNPLLIKRLSSSTTKLSEKLSTLNFYNSFSGAVIFPRILIDKIIDLAKHNRSTKLRLLAIDILGDIGLTDQRIFPVLLKSMASKKEPVATTALEELENFDSVLHYESKYFKSLLSMSKWGGSYSRRLIYSILLQSDTQGIQQVRNMLYQDKYKKDVFSIFSALSEHGLIQPQDKDRLAQLYREFNQKQRDQYFKGYLSLRNAVNSLIPEIIELHKNHARSLNFTLGLLRPPREKDIPKLENFLKENNRDLRILAAELILDVYPEHKESNKLLMEMIIEAERSNLPTSVLLRSLIKTKTQKKFLYDHILIGINSSNSNTRSGVLRLLLRKDMINFCPENIVQALKIQIQNPGDHAGTILTGAKKLLACGVSEQIVLNSVEKRLKNEDFLEFQYDQEIGKYRYLRQR